ncbi:hypothetical protein B0T17DRAFT_133168 [Bombardia bombarda]|uniref:Uncharacterized protein n=1 Tax=Bombardia bombarda TaxID=252184 RepID=A0AA39U124_9PEZI|nr:hypothetical protein B0T17DRAFT_133168 [Bombardia bombarda]
MEPIVKVEEIKGVPGVSVGLIAAPPATPPATPPAAVAGEGSSHDAAKPSTSTTVSGMENSLSSFTPGPPNTGPTTTDHDLDKKLLMLAIRGLNHDQLCASLLALHEMGDESVAPVLDAFKGITGPSTGPNWSSPVLTALKDITDFPVPHKDAALCQYGISYTRTQTDIDKSASDKEIGDAIPALQTWSRSSISGPMSERDRRHRLNIRKRQSRKNVRKRKMDQAHLETMANNLDVLDLKLHW